MSKLFLLVVTMSWSIIASAQGIDFFHGSYEEALKKARSENKGIFVDVYTSWCGPCKKMAWEVFTQAGVGDYFNTHFVCLKLDAEKDKEHPFFQHFKATAFPAFFWLNGEGEVWDMHVGYAEPQEFLKLAAAAAQSDLNKQLDEGRRRWESGERTPDLIRDYVLGVLSKVEPDRVEPMMWVYLEGLSSELLETEENYRFLKRFMQRAEDNLAFRTLLNKAEIYQKYEKGYDFWINMYRMVVRCGIVQREEPEAYQAYLRFLKELNLPLAGMYLEILNMEYTLFEKDFQKGIPEAMKLIGKYKEKHPYLAGQFFYTLIIAGFFQEEQVGMELADQVVDMAYQALKTIPSKENLLYLSVAYARKGDYKKAFELMAGEPFFPSPVLSNALYKYLNLPVFHRDYIK